MVNRSRRILSFTSTLQSGVEKYISEVVAKAIATTSGWLLVRPPKFGGIPAEVYR